MSSHLVRVTILGVMPGGEEWSVTPTYDTGAAQDISYADCAAIVTGINALTIPAALRTLWNGATGVAGVRVEAREYDGSLQAQAEGLRTVPVVGTSGVDHPFQTALVSSLRTPLPGGRGRGRLYWPATGASMTTATLRVSPSSLTSYLTGVAGLLEIMQDVIETVLEGPVVLAVWSRANQEATRVTQILVGDVLDTQRRRRDSIPESYAAYSYSA